MTVKCEGCGKTVEALPIHRCANVSSPNSFKACVEKIAFGLTDREKRNLKFAWDAAIDEAVKIVDNSVSKSCIGIVVKLKELK